MYVSWHNDIIRLCLHANIIIRLVGLPGDWMKILCSEFATVKIMLANFAMRSDAERESGPDGNRSLEFVKQVVLFPG